MTEPAPPKVARIVLAAGAGTRLGGVAKALLPLEGSSALSRIAALRLPGLPQETIVVGGCHAEAVGREARALGLSFVCNPRWAEGPETSLAAGLAVLPEAVDWILLHPVDLPLVGAGTYRRFGEALREAASAGRLVLVTSNGTRRGHPAAFHRSLLEEFQRPAPNDSARSIFRRHDAETGYVVVDDPWILRDIDEPADLEAAIDDLRRRRSD